MENDDLGNELNFWQDIPDDILGELENGLSERENPFGSTIFDEVAVGTNNWLTGSQDKLRQSSDVISNNSAKPTTLAASNNLMLSQTLQRELSMMNKPNVTIKTEPGTTTITNAPLEPIFQDARQLLQGLFSTSSRFDAILRESTDKQRKLTTSQTDEFSKLVGTLFSLQQEISKAIKDTVDILRSYVLRPSDLSDALVLKQSFQFQNQRAELYSTELANIAKEDDKCIASLAITEQPFSQVVFKARPVDGHFTVDILTGIRTQLEKASLVSAALTDEEAFKSPKPIENDKAELQATKHRAQFEDLKINVSTRMTSVSLKFTCHVKEKGKTQVVQITSPPTYPMIVITNESQWGEAAGKLLQAEVFPTGTSDVPWALFINYVHINLLNATQQDFKSAQRPLCDWEIRFLHSKFFGNSMKVTREQAELFWKWFGQVLTTIRFKRHVRSLWFTGIVYGLVNKKDCSRILGNEEVGTFLIRFSDSSPGSFAVAYVADDPNDRVKHYLIKPEDIGSNKSLPDFLKERHHFVNLVKLDPANGNLSKCNKDIVFKAYSSTKRAKQPPPDKHGYVQHVS